VSKDSDPTRAARQRRSMGTVESFSGSRLSVARRMARLPRAELARRVGVTPTAITQLERGYNKPTTTVAAELSLALGVPRDFLQRSVATQPIAASTAHFRSLRSTPAISREQALAFAELGLELLTAVEDYVDLPEVSLPSLEHHDLTTTAGLEAAAADARRDLGLTDGPVPNVVRLLESHGVLVLRVPEGRVDRQVDAFSTSATIRPVVVMSPLKDDKARSRFDAAHELGHLVLHADAEPGSKVVEHQAQSFAAAFLTPADQIAEDLPRRLDWQILHRAKRRWGVSLKALLYRARSLGLITDGTYRRGNMQLADWGNPEPGPLGPPEQPSLLGTAASLLGQSGITVDQLASHAAMPLEIAKDLIAAATDLRPSINPHRA
jgi:Zn-dependent peptidase ImmA (M78 family)/transcriptional regulator with XRE-family HTH domain